MMPAPRSQSFHPLTEVERQRLSSASADGFPRDDFGCLVLALPLVALLFWLGCILVWELWNWLALIPYRIPQRDWIVGAWIPLTLLFAANWVWRARREHQFRKTLSPAFAVDLAQGVAAQEDISVTRVFELGEYEDEGVGFLLEMEGGGVLCLISQDHYEYSCQPFDLDSGPDLRSEFPHTRIRYGYAPNSGTPFSAAGIGAPLRPSGFIPGAQKIQRLEPRSLRRTYVSPEEGCFYPGTLEDVCARFNFHPEPVTEVWPPA